MNLETSTCIIPSHIYIRQFLVFFCIMWFDLQQTGNFNELGQFNYICDPKSPSLSTHAKCINRILAFWRRKHSSNTYTYFNFMYINKVHVLAELCTLIYMHFIETLYLHQWYIFGRGTIKNTTTTLKTFFKWTVLTIAKLASHFSV